MKITKLLMALLIATGATQAMQKEGVPEQAMQEEEPTFLIFTLEDKEVAKIPIDVAKEISEVFRALLTGEWKDKNIIEIDESEKEVIKLFQKLVAAELYAKKDILKQEGKRKAPLTQSEKDYIKRGYIEKFIQNNRHLLYGLSEFLEKFQVEDELLISLVSDYLIKEMADSEELYNRKEWDLIVPQDFFNQLCKKTVYFRKPIHAFDAVWTYAFSPDGKYIAIIFNEDGGTVRIYNTRTMQLVKKIDTKYNLLVGSISYIPGDEGHIAIDFIPSSPFTDPGIVQIYTIETGEFVNKIDTQPFVTSISFSPDGSSIAIASSKPYKVQIFDVKKKGEIHTINLDNFVNSIGYFTLGDQLLMFIAEDFVVRIYDTKKQKILKTFKSEETIKSVRVSPNGKTIAIVADNTVQIYDMVTGELINTIDATLVVWSVSFSDGETIIIADGNTVQVYNIGTNSVIHKTEYDTISVRSASISPDGKFLALQYPHRSNVKLQPLHMCDRPEKEMLATFILMDMDESVKLKQSSWVYKAFMKLPQEEQDNLKKQYPHIKTIMENSITDTQKQEESSLQEEID